MLADKGYAGAGDHARIPYQGRGKPASHKDANRAHAQLRSPDERANAQLKIWRILKHSGHGSATASRPPGRPHCWHGTRQDGIEDRRRHACQVEPKVTTRAGVKGAAECVRG